MKKIKFFIFCAMLFSLPVLAQEKTSSDGKVGTTVNKVGNKTAKVAVKTKSAIVDKKYKDKVGPDGQTICINNKSQYYYVDDRGKKVFVKKAQLKDKQ